MKAALALISLLAGCSQQPASPPANEAVAPAPAPARKPVADAFVLEEKTDLIEFHYGWSAEAAAVPELVKRFKAEMDKAKAELVTIAKEDKAFRDKEKLDFNGLQSSTQYSTAGQSARLLSLKVEASSYTGGAHGNYGTNALLWDRATAREIKSGDLFADPSNRDRLLTQRWCDALNKAREERRGEPVGGDGPFDDCPKLDDIAVIPTDKDGNGRFERLELVASPYVAGPYVEGVYELGFAVTPDLLSGLKAAYRDSFEPGQPQ